MLPQINGLSLCQALCAAQLKEVAKALEKKGCLGIASGGKFPCAPPGLPYRGTTHLGSLGGGHPYFPSLTLAGLASGKYALLS